MGKFNGVVGALSPALKLVGQVDQRRGERAGRVRGGRDFSFDPASFTAAIAWATGVSGLWYPSVRTSRISSRSPSEKRTG